ncbi:hypothetical protein HYX19_00205 [Candidatus Woesearchaeota archaeon]|nr:hypothetical protein [Candidatus Woesearchaeota archaeon]
MKKKISITVNKLILRKVDSLIDRLFIRNRSQAIEVVLKETLDKRKTAVILLGGPEELIQVGKIYTPFFKIDNTPIIEKAVIKLREENFKKILIIARKKIIDMAFSLLQNGSQYGINIIYIEEKDSSGTADSLRLARKELSSSFLVVYGDIIFDKINLNELWDHHSRSGPISTLTLTTFRNPSIKGEVFLEGDKITGFDQKPKKFSSYLVFSPIFICEPELLIYHGHSLEKDIFPIIAEKRLLNGYVSRQAETHIHVKNGRFHRV